MNAREVFEDRKAAVLSLQMEMTDLDNPPSAERLQQLKEKLKRQRGLYEDALANLKAGNANMTGVDLLR